MVLPVIAAVAASALINEYQKAQTQGDDKKAAGLMNKINDLYAGMEAPELSMPDYQGLAYEDLQYNPITSKWENMASDPAMLAKQQASLAALDQIAQSGGMTLTDKANLADIQSQSAMQDRARREAIQQNMAARGMGGSGNELLAQLSSSQAATNQSAQAGLDTAGRAQERALQSILQSGQLAGDIRQQGWGEQAQKAQALDAISQFNQNNLMNTQQYNKGMGMDVQKYNVGLANQTQDAKNAIAQQNFQNDLNIKAGQSGAYGKGMDYYGARAGQKAAEQGQIFGGAGQALAAYYGSKK
jgi:hypothetical protein